MHYNDSISIVVGGDFCPVGRPQSGLLKGDLTAIAIVGSINPLYIESDISIVNLECPLTDRGTPIAKIGWHYRANPKMIQPLTHLKMSCVTLANNHIRDFGDDGVTDTLKLCVDNGIATVGAGRTRREARRPLFLQKKGRCVAFLNVAEQEFSIATTNRAGANPFDLMDLLVDLRVAQAQSDHVILIMHGGLEFTHCPSPASVKLLRFLAEQGVAAVIRHHSHFVQGHEVWKGVPIFYGLGNFLFDVGSQMDPGWYEGLVVKLRITPENKCSFELFPISQYRGNPTVLLLEGELRAQMLQSITEYSALLSDEAALSQAWEEEVKSLQEDYYGKLLLPSNTLRRIVRRIGLMKYVHPGKWSARYWENLLRCDTHREVLLDILARNSHE